MNNIKRKKIKRYKDKFKRKMKELGETSQNRGEI